MSNYTHVTANGSTLTVEEALAYAERNGVHKPDYMSLEDAAEYVRENYPQFSDLTLHVGDPARTTPEAASVEFDTDFPEFTIEPVTDQAEAAAREQIVNGLRTLGHTVVAHALSGMDPDEFDAIIIASHEYLTGEGEDHGFLDAPVVEPAAGQITVAEFIAAATALREVL